MNPREIVYGVVLDHAGIQALATTDGYIVVGAHTDMLHIFGGKLAAYVPIDKANTSVPLLDIREHVPMLFERTEDAC